MGNKPGANPEEGLTDACEECDGHSDSQSDASKTQAPSGDKDTNGQTDADDSVVITSSVTITSEANRSLNKDKPDKQSSSSTGKR